jgi:hypothetical protein
MERGPPTQDLVPARPPRSWWFYHDAAASVIVVVWAAYYAARHRGGSTADDWKSGSEVNNEPWQILSVFQASCFPVLIGLGYLALLGPADNLISTRTRRVFLASVIFIDICFAIRARKSLRAFGMAYPRHARLLFPAPLVWALQLEGTLAASAAMPEEALAAAVATGSLEEMLGATSLESADIWSGELWSVDGFGARFLVALIPTVMCATLTVLGVLEMGWGSVGAWTLIRTVYAVTGVYGWFAMFVMRACLPRVECRLPGIRLAFYPALVFLSSWFLTAVMLCPAGRYSLHPPLEGPGPGHGPDHGPGQPDAAALDTVTVTETVVTTTTSTTTTTRRLTAEEATVAMPLPEIEAISCDLCGADCSSESFMYVPSGRRGRSASAESMDLCPACFAVDAAGAYRYAGAERQCGGAPAAAAADTAAAAAPPLPAPLSGPLLGPLPGPSASPPAALDASAARLQNFLASLECPITCERFVDPVLAPDGHTYEREAIEQWLAAQGTSPLTGERMPPGELRTNWVVRSLLEQAQGLGGWG